MANMVVSSSKALITASSLPTTTITSAPTSKPRFQLPQISIPQKLKIKITKHQCDQILASSLKSSAAIAAAVLAMAPPSMAVEMEKAALFDFNLTLPIIMTEFLLLMVALDKIYFTPLGKFMDERDAAIKEKLSSVKDTSAEVKQLEDQASAVMKAARAEISAALNQMKKETTLEVEKQLAEGRKKVEAELSEALANLEKQKEETIKALDSQIVALSDEIVKKVLPVSPN
ncbi:ATP synthase subunit b', chloroplastic [Macadamia integrifolia]|uniref:ATP synthase subunit b', chloroplastic n=1 Tax=Macadamia integrifolia TaxID=60698 RepID=UPI001C4F9A39|nr:ATP synthase subunit b', chloroplastic [Macadamia integrifolia]